MNKRSFIKKLREKLFVLDEEELNDIIEEYEDTIEEKIKNGKTEEEAISDFGDIDELTTEILKAYKINPKYKNSKKETIKETTDDFEDFIKKTAKKASKIFNDIVEDIKKKDKDITIDFVFEIIIKSLILLVVLVILRLPFLLLTYFGDVVFDFYFMPFTAIFSILWNLIIWLLYIITCALVGIAMFKDNLKRSDKIVKKKETEKVTKEVTEEIKEEVVEVKTLNEEKRVKKSRSEVINVLIIIVKITLFITVIFPLWLATIGIAVAIITIIYHMLMGIELLGILLVLIGLFIMLIIIINKLENIFKNNNKTYLFHFLISLVFIIFGVFDIYYTFNSYSVVERYPNESIQYFNYDITENTVIKTIGQYGFIHDENYEDDKILVEVKYYEPYLITNDQYKNTITINKYLSLGVSNLKEEYEVLIENLQNKRIISNVIKDDIYINIYGNKETLNKLTFKNIQ